ncbi:MAG: alpha/beta hydrolase [Candidatus Nanopelagicus sp.]
MRYRASVEISKQFQLRGVPGLVNTTYFGQRRVDFWAPDEPTEHMLIAHDGQNIFDRKSATFRSTWRLAQSAYRLFTDKNLPAPLIIAVFHSGSKSDPNGRGKELTPQASFEAGVKAAQENISPQNRLDVAQLRGDDYQREIAETIIPEVTALVGHQVVPNKTAMIGASMGGLATLYGLIKYPNLYSTGLALSPHWILGNQPLVVDLINRLPKNQGHKIWMSRGTSGLDAKYESCQIVADQLMLETGWQLNKNFKSEIFDRASHNERAWAKQVPEVLEFWVKN